MIYKDKPANNILLIDINVPDYEQVVESVNSDTLAIVYDYNDTYEDLSNILQNYDISRGRVGIFFELNKPFLNGTFFETTSSMIDLINYHKIPHIDYLACNTLNYPEWTNYYKQLPCIVGASNNDTGNPEYGGDWIMESTEENIEFVYFTNIKYKHLLGLLTKSNQSIFAAGYSSNQTVIIPFDANNSTVFVMTGVSGGNQMYTYNLSLNGTIPAGGLNNNNSLASCNLSVTGGVNSGAVYSSNYTRSINYRGTAQTSNKWLYFTTVGSQNIYLFTGYTTFPYYTGAGTLGGSINKWNNICIYNSKIFHSSTDIYTITITDGTSTSSPTLSGASVYISNATLLTNSSNSTILNGSTNYYPMQLTCDTNNNLYISMGYIGGTPLVSDILVYNISGATASFVRKISFNDTFSQITYGYYFSLKCYNNILYIGTYIGTFPNNAGVSYSSTSGYLFAYDTLFNVVKLYTTSSTYAIGGIDIDTTFNYLCTSSAFSNAGSITTYTPLNTFSGFYSMKNTTYGIDSNSIVL